MPTYRLLIEYDGTRYAGWQIQPRQPTVQDTLEHALATVLRKPTSITGSGRTDAGVHARGQVAHLHTEQPLDAFRLVRSLNGVLPDDIVVLAADPAPEDFHARYDARRRCYHYYISAAPRALERAFRWHIRPMPNLDAMNEAARHLLGTHDFSAFCRTQSETKNRVCTVEHARWVAEAREGDVRFEIAADRFLHGMVRAIVGTLVKIGQGRWKGDALPDVLASEDRRNAGPAAPPHGLVLEQVCYPSDG